MIVGVGRGTATEWREGAAFHIVDASIQWCGICIEIPEKLKKKN